MDLHFESAAPPLTAPAEDVPAEDEPISLTNPIIEVTEEDLLTDPEAVLRRLDTRASIDLTALTEEDIVESTAPPPAEASADQPPRKPRAFAAREIRGADRRRGVRYGTVVKVTVPQGPLELHCRGLEISASGIVLDWGKHRQGHPDLLTLRIHLPDGDATAELVARSVWQRGALQGMKFVLPNDTERLAIAEVIDALRRADLLY